MKSSLNNNLLGLLAFILLLYLGKALWMPLAMAGLCALSIYPATHFLEKKGWKKSTAILPPLLILFILFIAFVILFAWLINDIIQRVMDVWPLIHQALDRLSLQIENTLNISVRQQIDFLNQQIQSVKDNAGSMLAFSIMQAGSALVYLILIPVLIYLLLYHRRKLVQFVISQVPQQYQSVIPAALHKAVFTFYRYVQGILIVYLIVGILNTIGLAILNIPNALGFGMLAALLTAVPFVGIILGSIPPLILALTLHDSIWYPLGVVGIFSFVQYLEANLIFPIAVGNRLQMNALAVIVVMLGGALLWGMAGLILFLPALAIFRVIGEDIPPLKPWADLIGDKAESE
jgi:predicted PurR-regulated permease PerM